MKRRETSGNWGVVPAVPSVPSMAVSKSSWLRVLLVGAAMLLLDRPAPYLEAAADAQGWSGGIGAGAAATTDTLYINTETSGSSHAPGSVETGSLAAGMVSLGRNEQGFEEVLWVRDC